MRTVLFLYMIVIFLPVRLLFSQGVTQQQFQSFYDEVDRNKRLFSSSSSDFSMILGNPYVFADFAVGEMELKNGTVLTDVAFRYNIFSDEMEFIPIQSGDMDLPEVKKNDLYNVEVKVVPKDTFILDKPYEVKEIRVGGTKFLYALLMKKRGSVQYLRNGYFEVISDGKCQLLYRRELKVSVNKYASNYGGGGGDGSYYFKSLNNYFIRMNEGAAILLKKNKKEILSLLSDHKDEVGLYAKKEKLSFKVISDLEKIIQYYNSL
ncbi:MAG: hypothetical protein R2764_06195 [Bacteroidales bacterium]